MNLLIDGLPDTVEVAGQRLEIDTSFRTGILFEEVIQDITMSDTEKLQTALILYFPEYTFPDKTIPEAIQALLWFYRCGSDKPKENDKGGSGTEEEPPYSYEYDADYIYAAFMSAYGIDLTKTNLHWWQFRALFRSLPEDTQFMKVVSYRSIDSKTLSKMSKEQRQHYKKLKDLYALPKSEDRQQLESDLTQLLMNGGNPTDLM